MVTKEERIQQSIAIAHLYYEQELSQSQIAKQLSVSRPTVSRLLHFAKENGLVRIQIMDPLASADDLKSQIQAKYGIQSVHVVPVPMVNDATTLDAVGQYAATFLDDLVTDHDIIGIGWGKTIHAVATHLNTKDELSDVQVVQLKGSVSYSKHHTFAYESINAFANAYHAVPQYLPLPVIFDQKLTKDLAEKERHIQQLIELGKEANIAVFTVGTVRDSALVFQLNYFDDAEMKFLKQNAVGDVFSRFIDQQGKIVAPKIDERTIGIQLADLRQKKHSILVASGSAKVPAIDGALHGKYANVLIVDQKTAQDLVDY
ncbi:deoxyribonucleoside regulator [Paucilactobacillus hokkaidonensis JCM 18461]|uniref:Deoxyribonucleoside regulator n=2 Tax=Paucilactobacillus hokkaidonensis TaxID=1193095 RepID=A0A0A1GWK7_9LACO|nr:sugar-binding transcriptional regulator [Paucilactobacillus hokkaidonensis]KRO07690.1 citrate lyase regulator [Paucilactobacillus hokkaidonensis]BAP86405.1 deoxyribonucleoside regulator [Paucilactobacillus hokkaidonensis JCM 18461]